MALQLLHLVTTCPLMHHCWGMGRGSPFLALATSCSASFSPKYTVLWLRGEYWGSHINHPTAAWRWHLACLDWVRGCSGGSLKVRSRASRKVMGWHLDGNEKVTGGKRWEALSVPGRSAQPWGMDGGWRGMKPQTQHGLVNQVANIIMRHAYKILITAFLKRTR